MANFLCLHKKCWKISTVILILRCKLLKKCQALKIISPKYQIKQCLMDALVVMRIDMETGAMGLFRINTVPNIKCVVIM